jgi:DNA methylase
MFPETFVETWIERLTRPGDCVFDPFCGRGTTPFQALLMKRRAVANDINPVAYCVTRAKTNAPSIGCIRQRLTKLEREFKPGRYKDEQRQLPSFFRWAYSPMTLGQIVYLRSRLRWRESNVDCFLAALTLGSLHGEKSGTYLSNQMPRTISTKPAYSVNFWRQRGLHPPVRNAFAVLRRHMDYRYESEPPKRRGMVLELDMRELPRIRPRLPRISCAITSPPYLGITSFEEDQWLRLWFLGGAPHPTYRKISKDDRHESPASYWRMIADMWRTLGLILDAKADVVVRLGGKSRTPEQLIDALWASSTVCKRRVKLLRHEVSNIKNRQTGAFRPGSTGCILEVDCHFRMY